MEKLKIEYVDINSIKPYEKNAKEHPKEQIEQIKKSIKQFGMDDPIGIWHDTIVEGHGRLIACKELGFTEVPVIRLDHLNDEERRAYTLAHNKLTMNSDFDLDILNEELANFDTIDMSDFGFTFDDEEGGENPYSQKVMIPQYEVEGDAPSLADLVDSEKTNKLLQDIENANINDDEKEFLKKAATRHYVFNYRNIAEYYANATPEMQKLMEDSALVIIDLDNAIANGYVQMVEKLKDMIDDDDSE